MIRTILGVLNEYVLRFAWLRISWQVDDKDQFIPGSYRLHFPLRPSAWMIKKKT